MATIPVIDFSKHDMKPGSPVWDSVKVQVREALEKYGCFEAIFDRILELRKPIFGAMEELFDLPLQTKKLCVSNKPFRGYSAAASTLPESVSIDDPHIAGNIEQHLTAPLWPQGNITVSETMASFTKLSSTLEKTIRRMILESFGVEKYMDEHIDSTSYQMRIMKYESPKTDEPTLGIHEHRDQNILTLLYQNEIIGLEIQSNHGEWIDVKPSSESFVVVMGESLSVWLNGRLSSPCHRVMMKGDKVRYTVGLFATRKGGYRMKVPEELVDDKNPLLFKPYDRDEFEKFYYTQRARGAVNYDLKAYCSV